MFIKLAKKWPKLMQDWRTVEISMRRFGAPRLGWKSTTLAVVLLVFAFSQYTFIIIMLKNNVIITCVVFVLNKIQMIGTFLRPDNTHGYGVVLIFSFII